MNKEIFILSKGHSGSTLLDLMLGQFESTFSTGELIHLTWQYYREVENIDTKQKCTCGEKFTECAIWSKVIEKLAEKSDIEAQNIPEEFIIKYFDSLSFFEQSKADTILRRLYKDNIFRSILSYSLRTINRNNKLLYQTIREIIPNSAYVIDSSKDIIKYSEMRKVNSAFPIILIRNIDNIVKSQYVKDTPEVRKGWQRYYNKQVLPLIKDLDQKDYHVISFEKFISEPEKEIKKIGDKLKIDTSDFNETIQTKDYHIVAGNPMRYEKTVEIRRKELNENSLKERLAQNNLDSFFINRI